jgi:egghead protein (zeste-white 4 protein)
MLDDASAESSVIRQQVLLSKNSVFRIGYYLGLVLLSLLGVAYGLFFSELFFPDHLPAWLKTVMMILKLSWIIPVPYAILNYYSYFRYPVYERPEPPPITGRLKGKLYFRFVTRGRNPHLSAETMLSARRVLEATLPPDQWQIEVVSDNPLAIASADGQAQLILVPPDYQSPVGTRYKARALHYALIASPATDDDWIIHLDEETCFDEATVRAIHNFVAEESKRPLAKRQIGQGVILYGKGQIVNWWTTLADSLRVGDDYGRFRLQFEMGKAWFGMHGSFVVINNGIEKLIGFDHGFAASITKDAFFALLLQAAGFKFKFLNAFMYEKSPFSIADFIRQRRRWFGGLWLCVLSRSIPLKDRLGLSTFMLMWSTCWLSLLMVYINILLPASTPPWLAVIGGLSFSYYMALYLIGFFSTFPGRLSGRDFAIRFAQQLLLIPLFSAMEGAGVAYGLISPPRDFYIVQKEIGQAAPPGPRPALVPARLGLQLQIMARHAAFVFQQCELSLNAIRWHLKPRDRAGMYTAEFWLQALHLQTRRLPEVVCLNFEVMGLEQLRAEHDSAIVDVVLAEIGKGLRRSVRATDLVCRYRQWQFAVALLKCPEQYGNRVAERTATRLIRETLERVNLTYGAHLQLRWKATPLPHQPVTAPELRAVLERTFNPLASLPVPVAVRVEV